jgi:cell division protein FtsW (lipid II flippase)
VLLALTLVIGTGVGTAEGVPRWIVIGPIRIHTAEFAKIPIIMMLARVLSQWREPPADRLAAVEADHDRAGADGAGHAAAGPRHDDRLAFILIACALLGGHADADAVLPDQPRARALPGVQHLGLGRVDRAARARDPGIPPEGGRGRHGGAVNVVAGTIALPFWNSLATYQKNRILVFLDPTLDPRGAGYNLIQSQVAIGSGGLTGKGFLGVRRSASPSSRSSTPTSSSRWSARSGASSVSRWC